MSGTPKQCSFIDNKEGRRRILQNFLGCANTRSVLFGRRLEQTISSRFRLSCHQYRLRGKNRNKRPRLKGANSLAKRSTRRLRVKNQMNFCVLKEIGGRKNFF
ncbi:hypothetical protein CEXT_790311 [Caerostris extrusa]|uniref:Ribosomal protein S14 n=1 Tax=Caerostris extrusa TaxID=172846 RepID=A0AAV4VAM1_CAEEX|nr:hypothetical protein CEXT_790311 [Caerostris extrusa]